jgi:hypothetical protein
MPAEGDISALLRDYLIDMGDTLQEVSPEGLRQRGQWNQKLFAAVLDRVEALVPGFQGALVDFLAHTRPADRELIAALMAVDRLSAAYTYWTRLFPPRQADESMFVLSLLHDLSDRVEYAITLLDEA